MLRSDVRTYLYRAGDRRWARFGRMRVEVRTVPRRGGQLCVPHPHPLCALGWVVNLALDPDYGQPLRDAIDTGRALGLPEGPFVEPWCAEWRSIASVRRWNRLTGLRSPPPLAVAGVPFFAENSARYLVVPYSFLREIVRELAQR